MNGGAHKGPLLFRPDTGSTSPSPRLKDAKTKTEAGRGRLVIILLSLPSFLLRPLCFMFFVFLLVLSLAYSRLWRKECARPSRSFLFPARGGGLFIPSSAGLGHNTPSLRIWKPLTGFSFLKTFPLLNMKRDFEPLSFSQRILGSDGERGYCCLWRSSSFGVLFLAYQLCKLDPASELSSHAAPITL